MNSSLLKTFVVLLAISAGIQLLDRFTYSVVSKESEGLSSTLHDSYRKANHVILSGVVSTGVCLALNGLWICVRNNKRENLSKKHND